MKTSSLTVAISVSLSAALYGQPGSVSETALSPAPWAVASRGANHNVWQRTTYEVAPDGQVVPHVHQYVELASGLNHQSNGRWAPSTTEIDAYPGGAAATNGQTKVIFANNLNTAAPIVFEGPDHKQFQCRFIGLAYEDLASGSNVLIAQVQSCEGYISSNEVVYPMAFSGDVSGTVTYTYRLSGLEQDVILESQPPPPEAFGLSSKSTVLQAISQFTAPTPNIHASAVASPNGLGLRDHFLDFGAVKIGAGKALMIGQNQSVATGIYKSWSTNMVPGRMFLLESVPVPSIEAQLNQLPVSSQTTSKPISSSALNLVSTKRHLPELKLAKSDSTPMKVAKAMSPQQGLVLDYQTVSGVVTNYTWQGDLTYYVSGTLYLYGTNVMEGSTVIKFGSSVYMQFELGSTINCEGSDYRPSVMTSMNDNSIGETISGSSGNPLASSYSGVNVFSETSQTLSHIRVSYANAALTFSDTAFLVSDAQILHSTKGILAEYNSSGTVENALISNASLPLMVNSSSIIAENVTVDGGIYLCKDGSGSSFYATNCIVANVSGTGSEGGSFGGDHNGFYRSPTFGTDVDSSSASPFQTVAGGDYYLTDASGFRNVGTTNVDPGLLADLAAKSTYPPIAYTNYTFPTAMTFSPQAQRDTDVPDIGYHYDPIDYIFGGCTASSNLTFTTGTAVGWFRTSSGWDHAGYGVHLNDNVVASFNGTATSPDYWVRCTAVQEQDLTGGYGPGGLDGWAATSNTAPLVSMVFTRCSEPAADPGRFFRDDYGFLAARLNHCEFWSGWVGGYVCMESFTNCLFDRCTVAKQAASADGYEIIRNCTWYGGQIVFNHWESGAPYWYSSVRDCAVDGPYMAIDDPFGNNTAYADYDYNAYTNSTDPFPCGGDHDVTSVAFNWQTGPLGRYYQTANSPLIDKGDVTADTVGLYHLTTQTNLVWNSAAGEYTEPVEGTSVVDIGYHYVATDANGNPISTPGDGIPDYVADANGNGLVDNGEISWTNYFSVNGLTAASGLEVFTPLQ